MTRGVAVGLCRAGKPLSMVCNFPILACTIRGDGRLKAKPGQDTQPEVGRENRPVARKGVTRRSAADQVRLSRPLSLQPRYWRGAVVMTSGWSPCQPDPPIRRRRQRSSRQPRLWQPPIPWPLPHPPYRQRDPLSRNRPSRSPTCPGPRRPPRPVLFQPRRPRRPRRPCRPPQLRPCPALRPVLLQPCPTLYPPPRPPPRPRPSRLQPCRLQPCLPPPRSPRPAPVQT